MSRVVPVGDPVIDQFPVFDLDGWSKVSGRTDFTATIWKDGVVQVIPVTIAEIGTSGEYKIEWTPTSFGYWRAEVLIGYNKERWGEGYDVETGDIQDIYEIVRRIAGLSHENIFIDNTVYDANTQLVAARVRIFDTKEHCDLATDGGSETLGLLASYTIDSVWEFVNQFKTFKQVRTA
jgi:hypothetical protein